MPKLIIDVSQWQGVINWDAVKPYIDGAILRMGFGSDQVNQDDTQWERNVSECERLGIPYGAYFYSYANNDARAKSEIQHTLRLLKQCKKLSYPVYFDAEDASIRSYCHISFPMWDAAIKAAGYKTGLYSGYYFRRECMPAVTTDTWWLAWYNGSNGTRKPNTGNWTYDAWQFTSSGSFPGISGRVDTNYFYKDFGSTAQEQKPATVTQTTAPRLDLEVQTLNHGRSGKKYGNKEVCMDNDAITGVSIGVTCGTVEYRVHKLGGGWFSKITKCDWATPDAYAGNLSSMIDGLQIYFKTDTTKTGGKYYRAKYSVKTQHRGWLPWVYDTNWESGDGSHTAGIFGDPIIGIRAEIV